LLFTSLPAPAIVEEGECTTVVGFHSRFRGNPNLDLTMKEDKGGGQKLLEEGGFRGIGGFQKEIAFSGSDSGGS
jgi:hypothetical protein